VSNSATANSHHVLDISFTETLSASISYWNEGITWQLKSKTREQVLGLFAPPLAPLELLSQREDCQDWYLNIPEAIRTRIHDYRHIDFALLYITSHYQYAYELFISHPHLLWLLLCEAKENEWTEEKLISIIGLPRKAILAECGLPATQASVRLLAKFNFERYDMTARSVIKSVFALSSHEKLNHHRYTINLRLTKLMVRHPVLTRQTFMHNLAEDEWNTHISTTLNDVFRLADELDQANIINDICTCKSNSDLIELHDRLTRRLNRRMYAQNYRNKFDVDYPAPPLEGTETIIPIRNGLSLIKEGDDQRHCAASYHNDIVRGEYYIYKVLAPERATLGLILAYGQKPKLEQVYLKQNKEVSAETMKVVLGWLTKAPIKGGAR